MATAERPGVLLDLDGTVLTLPVPIERVRAELVAQAAELGIESGFRPILSEIDRVVAQAGAPELKVRWRAAIDAAEIAAAPRSRARPGAGELARYLLRSRTRFGIVTDNGRACVGPALRAAGLAELAGGAQVVVTRDDVEEPKPHPAGVERAAAALGCARVYFAGDSERDMGAARSADVPGVEVVGVGLASANAAAIIESLADLVALLGG